MGITVCSCQVKRVASTKSCPARHSARLIVLRGLSLLILAGLFPSCASYYIDVPQPARLSLPATGSMVITVPDASYQEVVLGLQLKKKFRKAHFYSLPTNKELEEYLLRTGHSIQDLWKDPKLAQGLSMDMAISPRVIEWKKEESTPTRRVRPEGPGVVLNCTIVTGTLRTAFTLWRISDGAKLFEEEITSSRRTKECTNDWDKMPDKPTTAENTPGASVNPFLTGTLDASWQSDPLFESTVEKAVSSFVDHIDPKPFREVFITVNDMAGYESARQLVKARKLLRDNDWAAALTVLENNLGKHPDSYATLYLIGVAQQGQREFETAKKSYQQALTLCQSKLAASTPEATPDCDSIEEAVKRSQTWNTENPLKNVTGAE
jgi:tetratricopeptide (TPR) repeat protein